MDYESRFPTGSDAHFTVWLSAPPLPPRQVVIRVDFSPSRCCWASDWALASAVSPARAVSPGRVVTDRCALRRMLTPCLNHVSRQISPTLYSCVTTLVSMTVHNSSGLQAISNAILCQDDNMALMNDWHLHNSMAHPMDDCQFM
jgi:hypothetical protein